MRIAALVVAFLGLAGTAYAEPLTLICTGTLTLDGKETTINRETAVLDLEYYSFKPPMYPEFPVTRLTETDVYFGTELANRSISGNLDRVSGTLSMTIMLPSERKALQAGGMVRFLAFLTAKCVPTKRMF